MLPSINKLFQTTLKGFTLLLPWMVFMGVFQYHFQSYFTFNSLFVGPRFFDFFTVTDLYVLAMIIVSGLYIVTVPKQQLTKIPRPFLVAALCLLIAYIAQTEFQQVFEPVVSTPSKYFRSLILFPFVSSVIILLVSNDRRQINQLKDSYLLATLVFCLIIIYQIFTKDFLGDVSDFMGRLVWPFVNFITLKVNSANWLAFVLSPALVIASVSAAHEVKKHSQSIKQFKRNLSSPKFLKFYFYSCIALVTGLLILQTQSYSAYAGILVATALFCLRFFNFKQLFIAALAILLVSGVIYFRESQSQKYKVMTDQVEYRFDNSITSRKDIYNFNLYLIKEHPIMGIGLNQYQSYFQANHQKVLQKKFNEVHFPPHAHNFFLSFWFSLGIFGLIAILIIIGSVFIQNRFAISNPAIFALVAIMVHGLLDSYYWKQEVAYIVWFVITLAYLFQQKPAVLTKE